jgi:hypothetical protein
MFISIPSWTLAKDHHVRTATVFGNERLPFFLAGVVEALHQCSPETVTNEAVIVAQNIDIEFSRRTDIEYAQCLTIK